MKITKHKQSTSLKGFWCTSELIEYCKDSYHQVFIDDNGDTCFISDNYRSIIILDSGAVYTHHLNDEDEINWPLTEVTSPFTLEIDPKG